MKKVVTILLILALLGNNEPIQPSKSEAAPCAPCIIGALVLLIGGYIVYELYKMCKSLPPMENPPEPPPTHGSIPPTMEPIYMPPPMAFTVPTNGGQYSIVGAGLRDEDGYPLTILWCGVLESSTNMVNWQPSMTFTTWIS